MTRDLLVLRSVVADLSGRPLWSVSTLATPFCHTTLWKWLEIHEQPGVPVEPPLGEGGRRVRKWEEGSLCLRWQDWRRSWDGDPEHCKQGA